MASLIALLEAGTTPWRREWDGAAGGGHHANLWRRRPGPPREELVAELGAVLLGQRLEIGSAMANHAAYLGHWVDLLRESPRVLLQVLSDARRAADLICPEPEGVAQPTTTLPTVTQS